MIAVTTDNISLTIAVLALMVAILTGVISFRISRQANSLSVLVGLFGEYRTDHTKAREWLGQQLDDPERTVEGGYEKLPRDVVLLSHYLDNLGLLVYEGVVSRRIVGAFVGGAVVHAWRVLRPYCIAERLRSDRTGHSQHSSEGMYQEYFEYLALHYHLHHTSEAANARVRARNERMRQKILSHGVRP